MKGQQPWWAEKWRQAFIEQLGINPSILRSILDSYHVDSFSLEEGQVLARVTGEADRPRKVVMKLRHYSDLEWEEFVRMLAEEASITASLLNGRLTIKQYTSMAEAGFPLIPVQASDWKGSCTCHKLQEAADLAPRCDHWKAAYLSLTEWLEQDAMLLVELRGLARGLFIDRLRTIRSQRFHVSFPGIQAVESPKGSVSIQEVDHFKERSIVLEAGDPPFWSKEKPLHEHLDPVYDKVTQRASRLGLSVGVERAKEGD